MEPTQAEKDAADLASLEQWLKGAFTGRDEIAKQLKLLDDNIMANGRTYWKLKGNTVYPRIERLREAIFTTKG